MYFLKKPILVAISFCSFQIYSTPILDFSQNIAKFHTPDKKKLSINTIKTSHHSKYIACALSEGYIDIWNKHNNTHQIHKIHENNISTLLFINENELITGSYDAKVKHLKIDSSDNLIIQKELINDLKDEDYRIESIKKHPIKSWAIIAITGNGLSTSSLKILDLKTLKISKFVDEIGFLILALELNDKGSKIAISCFEEILIIDTNNKEIKKIELPPEEIATSIIFHNNNIIAGFSNGLIQIYNSKSSQIVKTIKLNYLNYSIYALKTFKNHLIFGGANDDLIIFNLETDNVDKLNIKDGYSNSIFSLELTDNNNNLAVGYEDGTLSSHAILLGSWQKFKTNLLSKDSQKLCDINIITYE